MNPYMAIAKIKSINDSRERIENGTATEEDYRKIASEEILGYFVGAVILFLLSLIFIGIPVVMYFANPLAGITTGILINAPWILPIILGKYRYWRSKNG
jgi:hypothetical protein